MILIEELEKIQKRCSYLKQPELMKLSKKTGIPLSKIYGTASYYSFLKTEKKGKHFIRVCHNLPCIVNGSDNILEILKKLLSIGLGETTKDGKFSLDTVSCLGCCNNPPAMMIDDKLYTSLDEKKVKEILKKLR